MSSLDLAERVLLALTDASLKTLLLLLAASLLALVARSASARVRHLVWSVGLGGALLLLPLGALAPNWSIPGLQIRAPFTKSAERLLSTSAEPGALSQSASPVRGAGESPVSLADNPLPPMARVDRPLPAQPPLEMLILTVWALGLVGTLAWKAVGLLRARSMVQRARTAPGHVARVFAHVRRELGVRRAVGVHVSSEVSTPLTLGAQHAVILLPGCAESWSADELRLVLTHELIHVRRGDWLLKQLVHLAVALYWWLPLSWVALRRFEIEQELSCDEQVLAQGARPSDYAGLLLTMAARLGRHRLAPLPALDMARRSQMEGRLMAILDKSPRRKSPLLVIPLILSLAALVPALALVHPWLIPDQVFAPALVDESEVASGANRDRLSQIVREIDAAAQGIEAAAEETEATIEARVEPIHVEIEARIEKTLAPFHAKMEAIHEEMEPIHAEMEAVLERMEPFHTEIEKNAREIERLVEAGEYDTDRMRALEDAMRDLELHLEPLEVELESFDARMKPFEERMRVVELEMAPVEEELEALELEMAPIEAEIEALEVELAPFQAKMEELEDELEERLAAELRALVVAEVQLAGLDAASESDAIDEVVHEVMDRSGIHINDGALTLGVSIPRARKAIDDAFEGRMPVDSTDRLAEAFARFEVR